MWHTERLIGATWTRVAPWGNVDNAKDSAAFLADLTKVRTRVVDSLSLIVVWDSVEGAPSDDLNTQAPTVEEVTPEGAPAVSADLLHETFTLLHRAIQEGAMSDEWKARAHAHLCTLSETLRAFPR